MMNELFIFRDAALTPDLPLPFSSAPVDVMQRLHEIGKKTYQGDYFFHEDLRSMLATLHDAHVSYNIDCYSSYLFAQSLNLYAPVINGKQVIRVYVDHLKRGYQECDVLTIDGKEALPYLYEWATEHVSLSKDGGVRLNHALATQIYDLSSKSFKLSSGEFGERTTVPESGAVEYVLQCAAGNGTETKTVTLRDIWRVIPNAQGDFTDVHSYVTNMCLRPPSSDTDKSTPPSSSSSTFDYNPFNPVYHPTPKKSQLEQYLQPNPEFTRTSKTHAPTSGGGQGGGEVTVSNDGQTTLPNAPPPQVLEGAEKLGGGNATGFYRLKSQPNVGVIVIWTHDAQDSELDVILDHLAMFHNQNMTHILIDFQGNFGGSVDFASYLVQLFFPNKGPFDKSLSSDLRVTKDIQDLSQDLFNNTQGGLFDASRYVNFQESNDLNVQLYTNDDLFQSPVEIVKNSRVATYTKRTTLKPSSVPLIPELSNYPWTNNAANIRILSDGRCGSSCGLSSHQFRENYKVQAYAIGGYQAHPTLSVMSFLGGAVGGMSDLQKMFKLLDDKSRTDAPYKGFLDPLPYMGDVRIPILEVFASNATTLPLEYDAKYYAADHHIDFDPQNARHRDVMWSQVAAAAWSS
ncbi:hypothetical protein BGZ83_008227 [Gryganskiella cystojenkinii]|nr:hypothetical protein BGZ83_008227 [Gryganskiella cystojenkinii]